MSYQDLIESFPNNDSLSNGRTPVPIQTPFGYKVGSAKQDPMNRTAQEGGFAMKLLKGNEKTPVDKRSGGFMMSANNNPASYTSRSGFFPGASSNKPIKEIKGQAATT